MVYTVKQARLLAEKTQEASAEALGIHKQTYVKIEQDPDRATVAQAKKLAEFFGRKIDEIGFFCPETKHNV